MLLRRITQHLKQQNWMAVVIDFVIVVVGVFIVIQVANLNDLRIENQKSARFTERLIDDLRLEAWSFVFSREYYGDVLASAERAVSALEGETELSDEELLINAYRATQFKSPPQARATYDELISTGAMYLIRDDLLRELAANMYGMTEFEEKRNDEERRAPYRLLFRMIMPINIQHTLRTHPDVLPYLRLRMADVETRLTDTDPTGDPWLTQLREIAPEMP